MRDWKEIQREKDAYREHLASLPAEQKFELAEQIRDRANTFRRVVPREPATGSSAATVFSNDQQGTARLNLGIFGITTFVVGPGTAISSNATGTAVLTSAARRDK